MWLKWLHAAQTDLELGTFLGQFASGKSLPQPRVSLDCSRAKSCRQNLILHLAVPNSIPKPKLSCHGASLGLTRLLAWPRVSEGCQCLTSTGISENQHVSCLAGSVGVN